MFDDTKGNPVRALEESAALSVVRGQLPVIRSRIAAGSRRGSRARAIFYDWCCRGGGQFPAREEPYL